ncbi:hypothetical protein [Flavihumibacter profundi]|uniref:hypothetical protein n=1 Tax=Flavihumibacter profundi TaxID=2716883 RepID=UPI001CC45F07|nr:hypothetical protein [Flavihumibacter profundi]MBZ5855541.1 hypothetical protein [Flavihumibacter profundi]
MDSVEFISSVNKKKLPVSLSIYLETLWYAGAGNWHKAHELIQDEPGKDAALLHAYLHRVEGDQWNANYWYHKAGEKFPENSLEEEWEELVKRFL